MAMTSLPRFFLIQASPGTPYLRTLNIHLDFDSILGVPAQGSSPENLAFFGHDFSSPDVRFTTEPASKTREDPTLVHIKSCSNNKYWVAPHGDIIAATADKPEEDTTNSACTLFRVVSASSPGTFKFQSIRWSAFADKLAGCLSLKSSTGTSSLVIIDWEKLVILPSQVAFKSEQDGRYLRAWDNGYYVYNKFMSGLGKADPSVAYDLFPMPNGNYRIKSLSNGKFWRRSPNWIWADAEEDNHSDDTMFECIKISDNVIAFRNLGNNAFVGGLTADEKTDCLNAAYSTITPETKLTIEERVIKRDISKVEYRLAESRVYEEQVTALSSHYLENKSPHEKLEQVVTFSETTETTISFNNSLSLKLGASGTFDVSIVPLIIEGKIQLSAELSYQYQWGNSTKTTSKIDTTTKVVVPPSTNMKVSLMCSKGSADVPFSYTQTDLLPNGQTVTTVKHDGIYKVDNAYGFKIRSAEVDEQGQELKLLKLEPAHVTSKVIDPKK